MNQAKRKAKKTSPAGLAPLSPADEQAMQAQLEAFRQELASEEDIEGLVARLSPRPDDALWDCHLIYELGKITHGAIPAVLSRVFDDSADRTRRKALKKALYALQSRGVVIPPELWPREVAGLVPKTADDLIHAFVTPIYGQGKRFVVLETKRSLLGGTFLIANLSDVSGFHECHLYDLGRKAREEFWEALRQGDIDPWLAVPPEYALRILEECFQLPQHDNTALVTYRVVRERLLKVSRPQSFEEFRAMLPVLGDQEKRMLVDRMAELVDDPLFYPWMPPLKELPPWLAKLAAVDDSPLVLSEMLVEERRQLVIEDATAAFFPPDSRPLWGRRLLEMAYFLQQQGQADKARLAQAAGEDLLERLRPHAEGEKHFLKELVWQALDWAAQLKDQVEEARERQRRLILPGEHLLIR